MRNILGIDEVGRGPWAGPLVVGACVLHSEIPGLTDSKKLTNKRREQLNEIILANSSWGLGWVPSIELDEIGLSRALKKATILAAQAIKTSYSEIIIDGTINFLADTKKGHYVTTLKKADLLIPAVSAASIIAKVARDRYMVNLATKYPEYGFEKHVGYGTKFHAQMIARHGICPEHRQSFRPIKESLKKNTTRLGQNAETKVAEYLASLGHEIVSQNWKTRFCEIDIISKHDQKIYFTEVKYRQAENHGTGFESITKEKQNQMKFAAEVFMKTTKCRLAPLLAAASVTGLDFEIRDFLILQ